MPFVRTVLISTTRSLASVSVHSRNAVDEVSEKTRRGVENSTRTKEAFSFFAGIAAPFKRCRWARMKGMDQRLDKLVKRMNAVKGSEKTDAIAELLTALVQEHRSMHAAMMANMSAMMGTMPGSAASAPKR